SPLEYRADHHSHYGRMCPIETPEEPNICLINTLSSYARVNKLGIIETPYRRVDAETQKVTKEIDYLTADEEDNYVVAQANAPHDEEGHFVNDEVIARFGGGNASVPNGQIDYLDVSLKVVVSGAIACRRFVYI